MKKILITSLLCGMFLTSLSAAEGGKVKLTKSPIDTDFLSVENGGSLSAIDAYSDGVGMSVVGNSITVDNSKMNNSVFTDGLLAKYEVVSLKQFLNNKNSGAGENIEVIGASVGLTTVIGDPCNDGNSNTGNDIYIDNNGNCKGLQIKTENKCFGDSIGSEFIFNGKNHLVVDDGSIRGHLDRAETLCVSNVTYMSNLFKYNRNFNQDISFWDVSNVRYMSGMFFYAEKFNQPLNNWNVSNVVDMSFMFFRAYSFNQPLDNWDVSNVNTMSLMFQGTTSFNQNISNWNVSNVNNMDGMFAYAAFNQNLKSWNVNNVSSFSGFRNGSALTSANSAKKTISPYTIF